MYDCISYIMLLYSYNKGSQDKNTKNLNLNFFLFYIY